jgi:hypothetical protein
MAGAENELYDKWKVLTLLYILNMARGLRKSSTTTGWFNTYIIVPSTENISTWSVSGCIYGCGSSFYPIIQYRCGHNQI